MTELLRLILTSTNPWGMATIGVFFILFLLALIFDSGGPHKGQNKPW